jgi:uncharacterized membrane protein YdbT with pleckstrin-like domain
MGTYVQDSLGKNEQVEYTARLSLWGYVGSFLLGGVFLLILFSVFVAFLFMPDHTVGSATFFLALCLLPALLIVMPLWARKSTELAITNNRLISKYGIFSTHALEIRLERIETVRVKQGLMGKLLNYGDILVTGTGTTFDPIPKISAPLAFRAALNQAMETRSAGSRLDPMHGRSPVVQ